MAQEKNDCGTCRPKAIWERSLGTQPLDLDCSALKPPTQKVPTVWPTDPNDRPGIWKAARVHEEDEPIWEEIAASAATCSQALLASRSVSLGRDGKGVGDTKVHFRKPSGLLLIASLIDE